MDNLLPYCLRTGLTATVASLALALSVPLPMRAAPPDIPSPRTRPEPDSIPQQIELAAAYLTGRGVPQDSHLAAYWYERAAAAGDPRAQKQIGYFYEIGLGVPRDLVRAVHWYQLAAAGGLTSAKVNLGVAYVWGVGVARNVSLGIQLFREASDKGNGLASCYLGDIYYLGVGVERDPAQGIKWYEKGAREHDPRAEFDLASLLSKEDDPARDLPRVADLLRHSAGEGFVPSMHLLGLLLVNHPQFAKTPDEALSLLNTSSLAGNWRSSAVLGVLEREGKTVPRDLRNAYYHFKLASLQGGEPGSHFLAHDVQLLQNQLGEADSSTIAKQAMAWYQQHSMSLEFIYKDGENWKEFPAFALATPETGSYAGQLVPTSPF